MTPPATRSPSPSAPAPRADRRAVRERDRRRLVLGGSALLVVVVVAGGLALAGVFDSGDRTGAGGGSRAGVAPKAATTVKLTAGATRVEAPLLFTKFPDGLSDQVIAVLTKYVDDGIVTALRTGKANDADLTNLVDAGVTAQLAGTDRAALFDEGLPAATGKLAVTATPVPISALVGVDGKAVIVVAGLQLDITATNARGPVHIVRTGDLQLAPDATGVWKVTGYDLTVNRDGKGVPVAKSGTSKGAGSATTTRPTTPSTGGAAR